MSRESDRCTGCQHQADDNLAACLGQDCSDSWPVQKLHSEVERLTSIIHNWARSHESASPVYKREPENKALFDEAFGRSSATETPS